MTDLLKAIGCLILITGAGAEINSWLFSTASKPFGDRTSRGARQAVSWGWSYLVGVAALGVFLYAPLALCGRISHSAFAAAWAGCGVLSGIHLARNWNPIHWWAALRRSWCFDLPRPACGAVLLLLIAAVWLAVLARPSSFDGRATFAMKARILFDRGSLQGEDFQDVDRVHFHADYPLLIPLTEAELFWARGSFDDLHLRAIFLAFVIALASIVAGEFRRYHSPRIAAFATALLLAMPMISQTGEGSGMSTEADFPLACFVLAGTLAMMQWLRLGNPRQAILAGLMFGAAAMTKDEGILWAGAAGFALLIGLACRRVPLNRIASLGAAFGFALLIIMLSLVVGVRRQIPSSLYVRNYVAVFQWDWLRQLWRRPADVLWYSLKNCFRTSKWDLIWPCIGASLCLRRNRPLPADYWYARLFAGIMAAGVLGIFILTPYPLHWHLQSAFYRLSLQLLPVACLVAVEQLSASGWTQQLSHLWTTPRTEPAAPKYVPRGHEIGLPNDQLVIAAEVGLRPPRKKAA